METGPWITGGCARRLFTGADWRLGDVDVFFPNESQMLSWAHMFQDDWRPHRAVTPSTLPPARHAELVIIDTMHGAQLYLEPHAHKALETDNAITWELFYGYDQDNHMTKLQTIKTRYADSLEGVWDTFDFNVCCFAVDAEYVYASPQAIQDLDNNEITSNGELQGRSLPLRVFKHFTQGFHVSDELLLQAVKQIRENEVDWCNNY